MKTIEATYRIVTPMFIGGADQSPSDGIRPPSFKGALRFWWRALNWGGFYQACCDEAAALNAMHKKESELFGRAVKDKNGGQGKFLLSIKQPQYFQQDNLWPSIKPLNGSGYLGMGLWESGSMDRGNYLPHRTSIISNEPFKVTLKLKQNISEKQVEQLRQSLQALGLFGGLGSRSRRGFGSIALEMLQTESFQCCRLEDYKQRIHRVFATEETSDVIPPFTSWSEWSRIGLLNGEFASGKEAHKKAAELFYTVRGMKAEVRGADKRGFGQPLPLKPMQNEYDARRSSPLFFHIHPVGNQFVCSHIFMPAQFLPQEGFDMDFYSGVGHYMDKLNEVRT